MNAQPKGHPTQLVLSAIGLAADGDGFYDFTTDMESARQFWAVALGFAAAEGADGVHFSCAHSDECLSMRTDRGWMVLNPPPVDLRTYFFRNLLDMLLGPWRSRLLRYTGRFARWKPRSRCLVETDTGSALWRVHCGHNWLAFVREGVTEEK